MTTPQVGNIQSTGILSVARGELYSSAVSAFELLEKGLNGQAEKPIHQLRRAAFKHFSSQGFPTPRLEEWSYTNLASLIKHSLVRASASSAPTLSLAELEPYLLPHACARLVFVDGVLVSELSHTTDLPEGVVVKSLSTPYQSYQNGGADVVSKFLGRGADSSNNAFIALNTAFLEDGALIHFGKKTAIAAPIQLLFVTTGSAVKFASAPRVLIVADEFSQGSVVETHLGLGQQSYLTNSVVEVFVGAEAKLEHLKLQLETSAAYHVASLTTELARTARFTSTQFVLGGLLVRNELMPVLRGEGADCVLNCLSLLAGDQHADNFTVVDHAMPHCESTQVFKGVYSGKSRGVFSGTIVVRKDAQKTNAIQNNASILLSETGTVDTKPQLKIWADDVKCTHGATVGQLDEAGLFYLRSRGIPKGEAYRMLVRAFSEDVVTRVSDEKLRSYAEFFMMNKLQEMHVRDGE